MPKTSPLTLSKILGNFFVLFVLLVISFIYFNVFKIYGPRHAGTIYTETKIFIFLFVFHLSLLMLLWSFFKTMLTDPGVVPPLWGFYMGDSENKRRRYCLMCHVFKPERCHHCSACNRCVLNMDHHCRN
jgi:palmitoyltransferase ZDHHC2/15/20